jgi:hypothetical protein
MDNSANNIYVDIGPGLSMMVGLPRLTSWDIKNRPKKAKRGTFGFNSETYSLEYFNGDHWFTAPMSRA